MTSRRGDGTEPSDLGGDDAPTDPLTLLDRWLSQAVDSGMFVPEAMALATVDAAGVPAVRMVLLKEYGPDGFVFFTNYGSDKAQALEAGHAASLLFWWREVQRQIRVTGSVARVARAESEAYFATRPRGSQLGAWASDQSRPIASRAALDARMAEVSQRFADGDIPCPEFWGGYRLTATRIEFWQGRDDRLHDRMLYTRDTASAASGRAAWTRSRLMP